MTVPQLQANLTYFQLPHLWAGENAGPSSSSSSLCLPGDTALPSGPSWLRPGRRLSAWIAPPWVPVTISASSLATALPCLRFLVSVFIPVNNLLEGNSSGFLLSPAFDNFYGNCRAKEIEGAQPELQNFKNMTLNTGSSLLNQ